MLGEDIEVMLEVVAVVREDDDDDDNDDYYFRLGGLNALRPS